MRAKLLNFLRNNFLLVIPAFLAFGVLVKGALQGSREGSASDVGIVSGVVSTPPVRFVDKSSWVYLSDYVTQLARGATSSLALVGQQRATGVFLESDLLLTSIEAIDTRQVTRVELADGILSSGSVLGYDTENGVAIIKLNSGVRARKIDTGPVEMNPGWAVAVGLDVMGSVVTSVTLLSIPRNGISIHSPVSFSIMNIHLPLGAKGAAILDLDGRLAGFIPATPAKGGIRRDGLLQLVRQMKNREATFQPWIGMEVSQMGTDIIEHLELPSGLLVLSVLPQGPAWEAGVRPGDILLELSGDPVHSLEEYSGILVSFSKGASVEFKLKRGSRMITRRAEVGEGSDREHLIAGGVWVESLGFSLKHEKRASFPGGKRISGLQVTYLVPGGLAYASGIRSNDFLLSVGGRVAYNSAQFRRQFERSSEDAVLVKLLREKKRHLVLLRKPNPNEVP